MAGLSGKNPFFNRSPLQIAALNDGVVMCRGLISLGADPEVVCEDSGATLMHFAALNWAYGLGLIEYFRSLGLDVGAKDKFGEKPIHYAIKAKNFELANHLLRQVDRQNNLLHFCVMENRLDLAKIVFENGEIQLSSKGQNGLKTIDMAARFADVDMCKWLVGEGANPEAFIYLSSSEGFELSTKRNTTVLHQAALNVTHGAEIIRYFVSRFGNDSTLMDRHGFEPMLYALSVGNVACAELFFAFGARLDCPGNLVHFSIEQNKLNSAKFCHEKNAKLVKKLNHRLLNSLQLAAEQSGLEMCKWLVNECRINPHDKSPMDLTLLHHACSNTLHGGALVEYFVQALKLDADERSINGVSPLRLAMSKKNYAVAEKLIELGASLDEVTNYKENFLHWCVRVNNLALAKLMHEKNPDLLTSHGRHGRSMLHYAARHADLEMCQWLESTGISARLHSSRKCSVLHFAAKNKDYGRDIVRYYLSAQVVDFQQKNIFGQTPLKIAKKANNAAVVEELKLAKEGLTSYPANSDYYQI